MKRPYFTPSETAPEFRSAHEPSDSLLIAAEAYSSEFGAYLGARITRLLRWIVSIFSETTASKRDRSDGGLFLQA